MRLLSPVDLLKSRHRTSPHSHAARDIRKRSFYRSDRIPPSHSIVIVQLAMQRAPSAISTTKRQTQTTHICHFPLFCLTLVLSSSSQRVVFIELSISRNFLLPSWFHYLSHFFISVSGILRRGRKEVFLLIKNVYFYEASQKRWRLLDFFFLDVFCAI